MLPVLRVPELLAGFASEAGEASEGGPGALPPPCPGVPLGPQLHEGRWNLTQTWACVHEGHLHKDETHVPVLQMIHLK
jgi:hypothetical protein